MFIEFPSKIGALEPWKIQLLRGTLWKNTEIASSDFTRFWYSIWDAFWHRFRDLWLWFSIFLRPWFSLAFLLIFLVALGTNMVPNWLPKWTKNFKKNEIYARHFHLGVLDANSTPFWVHFGRHLGRFGHLLAAIWDNFWKCLASFGHLLVIIQRPIGTLPSLFQHIKLPLLWLGRRAESQWRRTDASPLLHHSTDNDDFKQISVELLPP